MKPKKISEGITPESVTIGADTQPKSSTVNTAKWTVVASVELSNGQPATKTYELDGEPTYETVNELCRASIVHIRHHLPEGVSFDNSSVSMTVKKPS